MVEKGSAPEFGGPILWDLGGLGVRSLAYSRHHQAYFAIAGPHTSKRESALYRWSGAPAEAPVLVRRLPVKAGELGPEALIAFPGAPRMLVLSDDGTLLVDVAGPADCVRGGWLPGNKCENKYLLNAEKKTFRAFWVEP